MPLINNRNTTMTDTGTKGTRPYTGYGSNYGGASAGRTGSSLGVYGTTYATPTKKTTTTTTKTNQKKTLVPKVNTTTKTNVPKTSTQTSTPSTWNTGSGVYGSNYGGTSSGNTGSSLALYGSNYNGASTNPTGTASTYDRLSEAVKNARSGGTTTNVPSRTSEQQSALNKLQDAVGDNAKSGSSDTSPSLSERIYDKVHEKLNEISTPEGGGGGTPGGGSGSGSGGGSGRGSGGGSGGGATVEDTTTTTEQTDAKTEQDNTIDKIKELLTEQQKQAEDRYKTLYEQELEKNRQAWEANRNQINLNYKRGQRFADATYGNELSGAGLTNRMRLNSNWINNLNTNRLNYTNNDATALANYDANKSNAYGTLAQGWYNYVLPTYANRVQNDDDYSYRRFLAQSGLM